MRTVILHFNFLKPMMIYSDLNAFKRILHLNSVSIDRTKNTKLKNKKPHLNKLNKKKKKERKGRRAIVTGYRKMATITLNDARCLLSSRAMAVWPHITLHQARPGGCKIKKNSNTYHYT